jgi:arylsulfatase A-like enzyme
VEAVERLGLGASTLVVVTSDHGDYLGDHNLTGKSNHPYEGAMRIPLMLRGPGIPAGARSEELVEILDLMPTLLELAGLPPPKGNQGISLAPAMRGGKGRDTVFMEGRRNRILRTREAKYCYWITGEEALFDLRRDPDELRNIAAEPQARALLDEMRMRTLQKALETLDPLPEQVAPY